MRVRFSSFNIGRKQLSVCENGHVTKLNFSYPHRMMLSELSIDELRSIKQQCDKLLASPWEEHKTIFLGSVDIVEEVED